MDDNKFCDCAIAVHANWIVTEDRHFDVLRSETFRVKPIKVENFLARYFDQAGRFTP